MGVSDFASKLSITSPISHPNFHANNVNIRAGVICNGRRLKYTRCLGEKPEPVLHMRRMTQKAPHCSRSLVIRSLKAGSIRHDTSAMPTCKVLAHVPPIRLSLSEDASKQTTQSMSTAGSPLSIRQERNPKTSHETEWNLPSSLRQTAQTDCI